MNPPWKVCRREIVKKFLPFCFIDDASWYTSTKPESFFTPMEALDLSRHSLSTQEQLFVRDLFLVYTGCQGENIRFVVSDDFVEWTVNPSGDESLRSRLYTEGGLQLAALLIVLGRYVAESSINLSRGRVALTVGTIAGEFLRNEVWATVRNLEMEMKSSSQLLNIFTVTTRMRSFLQIVKDLVVVFSNIHKRELIGGEILTFLNEHARFCVLPSTTALLSKLERGALKQYLELVFSWIRHGSLLEDYYHEFMVWDLERTGCFNKLQVLGDSEADKAAFDGLDERYCVIGDLCPSQLKDVFLNIINCGKYMKIMEKLDVDDEGYDDILMERNILRDWQDKLIEDIQREIKLICTKASERLVLQLKKSFKMKSLVETIHSFFFLEYSDWLNQFFDLTEQILPHPVDNALSKKVNFYFEEAVNASCLKVFDFRNLFRITFDKCDVFTLFRMIFNLTVSTVAGERGDTDEISLTAEQLDATIQGYHSENQMRDQLSGAAALSLNVQLNTPMTLVFPYRILLKYELVFRILFCLHRSVYLLLGKLVLEDLFGEERGMLQNMLHVLNGYLSHCVSNVIPNFSRDFLTKLDKSTSLEEILSHHSFFFDQVFEKCFFSDIEFTNNLCDLVNTVVGYSTDTITFDQASILWKVVRDRLSSILVRPSNNTSYAQLHIRYNT